MPEVKCDWCGEDLWRKESRMKPKKHFCNRKHHLLYRKKYDYNPQPRGKGTYSKLRELAEMRKKKALEE